MIRSLFWVLCSLFLWGLCLYIIVRDARLAVGNVRSHAFQWAAFHAVLMVGAILILVLNFDFAFFVDELRELAGYCRL